MRSSMMATEDSDGSGDKTIPALAQATAQETVLLACDFLQPLPQGGLGCAVHTLIVLNLWATVTVIALFQAVIEQAQVFLHFLGLVYRVRVQDLWDQAQRAMKTYGVTCTSGQACTSSLPAMRHTMALFPPQGAKSSLSKK